MNRIEEKITEFKNWYHQQLAYHQMAIDHFSNIIENIDKVDQVLFRIKTCDECIEKFKRKYLPYLDPNTSFEIQDFITDLIGVRAVCYYSDDFISIKRNLKKYFRVMETTDKAGLLEETENQFGYKGLHLQLKLRKKRGVDKTIEDISLIVFELQIRTVIQDAWSILDHKIKYKKSIPHYLKRRINRLSALFEIADEEFLSIKKEILQEEKIIKDRLRKKGSLDKNLPLDVFRFLYIAKKHFADYKFIEYKVDNFVQEILIQKSNFTEQDLELAISKYLHFSNKIEKAGNQTLNPYTKIRYCLYRYNRKLFENILSSYQKDVIKDYT